MRLNLENNKVVKRKKNKVLSVGGSREKEKFHDVMPSVVKLLVKFIEAKQMQMFLFNNVVKNSQLFLIQRCGMHADFS